MTAAGPHPVEELRGRFTGFPVWPPVVSIDAAPDIALLGPALDWLAARLRWFDPDQWDRMLPPRAFPEGTALELLVLCRILRRGPQRDHPLIEGAIELARRAVSAPAFDEALGRDTEKFAYRAYLVGLLTDLGHPVPAAAERVRTILSTGGGGSRGGWHTPLSRLERRHALDLGGFVHALPPVSELMAASIAGAAPDPLHLRDDEVYALTHVLFYATDFAARPMHVDPALVDTLRTLLGVYLAIGDMDLAGELLLCLEAVAPDECPVTEYGWRVLRSRRLADGAVPGPLFDPASWARLHGEVAEAYAFGTCHHTTMVAAMAASERERRRAG